MSDFYSEVLSGKKAVKVVMENEHALAFYHTKPCYPVHIVAIPKMKIASLLDFADANSEVFQSLMALLRQVASNVLDEHGACRVITNLGRYQDSKHLHWHIVSGERKA
jgi:histidine triad (HIT) family protein